MGNDSTTAFRTREQLRKFLGIFSPRFSKPKLEFLGQMLFGIQAARDTLVSEIARSLQEDILAKKTQERLEHHLQADGLDDKEPALVFRTSGVLLLRDCGRASLAFRAARKVARPQVLARGARRPADGVRALVRMMTS